MFRPAFMTLLTLLPTLAAAQAGESGISFRLGFGPELAPGYVGAAEADVGVGVEFDLERFQIGGFAIGGEKKQGLGFAPSVRFVEGRAANDFDELAGLDDIDASFEMGGGLAYNASNFTGFAKLRYGIVGHESFVAEVGGDYLFSPNPDLTVAMGPRALWGDADYLQTYFGVSEAEAATSVFEDYTPGSGLVSTGISVEATYEVTDDWQVVGVIRYDRLQGDAADSPLTADDDQLTTTIAVTRRFSFGF